MVKLCEYKYIIDMYMYFYVYEEDIYVSMIKGNLLWYFICDKVLYGSN